MAYAAASSPSTVNGDSQASLKLTGSLPKPPKLHNVITSVPPAPTPSSAPVYASSYTTTPNSLRPTYNFSNASSPSGTPLQSATDSLRGRIPSFPLIPPASLELGESIMAVPGSASASGSGDAVGQVPNKGPGLMRRISRGAANKLTRRRQSASHNDKRDRSSGPVTITMRRRSDSKTGQTSFESALESSNEEDSNDALESLGVWCGSEASSLQNESFMATSRNSGAVAPKVDSAIQRGTILTKVTKKRRKQVRFFLDLDAGKVYWDVSNPTKRFYIDDIKEIRVGADARNYREEHQVPQDAESRWFTIVIADAERSKGRAVKTLHLIAPNDYILELWTTTLEHISRYRIGLMAGLAGSGQSDAVLKAHWQREMTRLYPKGLKPGELESLDFGAVESVCRSLHINCSKNMLRAQFSKADNNSKGKLYFSEFSDFVGRLKERKDVKAIFKDSALDPEGLTVEEFLAFLRDVQQEDVESDRSYWVSIFDKFVRKSKPRAPSLPEHSDIAVPRMGLDAFTSFLSSSWNGVYASRAPQSRFDRPLNEYFISSSHNTYLLGRQVAGASSTEAYISALFQGCRCVEIDCWDGADGRPIVSHGRTMTTSVLFADCITVINRYAFISTDFPLILSLEVHCNPEQQLAMVKIMKETFKDQLVLEPLLTNTFVLPSPEELKGRILVKVKTCDETQGDMRQESTSSLISAGRKRSSSSPFMRPAVPEYPMISNLPSLAGPSTAGPDGIDAFISQDRRSFTTTSISSATEDSDGALTSMRRERKRRQKSKITKPLSDLGVYTRGYKWHSFSSPESQRYNHVYSFAERSFESICRDADGKALFEKHNRKYLTRVYPSGFRLRSSNFDPLKFWRRGVQMAALNWQTYDVGMQMNQAMFAAGTDRTGYVLKPHSLRAVDPLDEDRKKGLERKLIRFSVDVISAQQLPRPRTLGPDDNINPYVEIEMFSADDRGQSFVLGEGGMNASARNGMSGIGYPHRRRTKIEQSNGYSPIFNDRFKLSLETKYPDLVFVRWTVWSSSDGRSAGNNNSVQLATFTAKLTSLSQGYRYLPLHDTGGDQYLFSTLFCKIAKEEPVSVQRLDADELRAERMGILRQIGQTVFKRSSSTERDRDAGSDKGNETPLSLEDNTSPTSPILTPTVSAASTLSLPP
ncbi:PLC-like phosphodiesterase [Aspergillus heteromorphus CBS 117.55]|uniref:Phosphoinositide phospholipase C n=1 Tax=Aspergillus heteromorphus CBS 117.55 TaxID=1448321 RepID=A0A317VT22_9EURO|nr:PLC-like phosphodiesterase [Aspergillus heteromorphus CBS 117.55]PWY77514.1 PLC-like phosphodiesterase [Aspergillus heteromorphus CBS 117.55]